MNSNTPTNSAAGKLYKLVPVSEITNEETVLCLHKMDVRQLNGITHYLRPYTPSEQQAPVREGSERLDLIELTENYCNNNPSHSSLDLVCYGHQLAVQHLSKDPNLKPSMIDIIDSYPTTEIGGSKYYHHSVVTMMMAQYSVACSDSADPASTERGEVVNALAKCGELLGANLQHVTFNKPSSEQRVEGEEAQKVLEALWKAARLRLRYEDMDDTHILKEAYKTDDKQTSITNALKQLGYDKDKTL